MHRLSIRAAIEHGPRRSFPAGAQFIEGQRALMVLHSFKLNPRRGLHYDLLEWAEELHETTKMFLAAEMGKYFGLPCVPPNPRQVGRYGGNDRNGIDDADCPFFSFFNYLGSTPECCHIGMTVGTQAVAGVYFPKKTKAPEHEAHVLLIDMEADGVELARQSPWPSSRLGQEAHGSRLKWSLSKRLLQTDLKGGRLNPLLIFSPVSMDVCSKCKWRQFRLQGHQISPLARQRPLPQRAPAEREPVHVRKKQSPNS